MTIYIDYGTIEKSSDNLNASLRIIDIAAEKTDLINISIPGFRTYHRDEGTTTTSTSTSTTTTTSTSTTSTVAAGGGGGGLNCPAHSHQIENNMCKCDEGYIKDSTGDCVASPLSIFPLTRTVGISDSAFLLSVAALIAALFVLGYIAEKRYKKPLEKKRVQESE